MAMATLPKQGLTPREYLALEEAADYKSEYYRGEMYAMSGATYRHNLIALNVGAEIRAQIRDRGCTVCPSDMRVHVPAADFYTYPDAVVICGEPKFATEKETTLLNPVVIVEVLSRSTEGYDRGRKFELYKSIDSFREYLLISPDRVSVTLYRRQANGQWVLVIATSLDSAIDLESCGCRLQLRDLYAQIDFSGSDTLAVEPE
jgi:Uma2 family endonuclease